MFRFCSLITKLINKTTNGEDIRSSSFLRFDPQILIMIPGHS